MESSGSDSMVELTALVWQEGQDFVSLCPELGVSSCGSDLEEAVAMLQEAVDLYLENARDLDMLDDTAGAKEATERWSSEVIRHAWSSSRREKTFRSEPSEGSFVRLA